jgi:Uma2 family endonuclease
MTAEEYLRWEDTQLERHEFVDGRVREMGAVELWPDMTAEHDLVVRRMGTLLTEQLSATDCEVLLKDAHTSATPDIEVRCGGKTCLIVEVMTPQSESHDYGGGFSRHRDHPVVQEIVQIALAYRWGNVLRRHVDHGNQWMLQAFEAGETVVLTSVELHVNVDELFVGLGPAPVPLYRPADSAT